MFVYSLDTRKIIISSVILLVLALLLVSMQPAPVDAQEHESMSTEVTIYVEGEMKSYDPTARIMDGRTMVPLRAIAEQLGATVGWNHTEETVTLMKDGKKIMLSIGSVAAMYDQDSFTLDTPPIIIEDRTFVPLRFIGESFDAGVYWDNATRSVHVNSSDGSNQENEPASAYFDDAFLDMAGNGNLKGCSYSLEDEVTASMIIDEQGEPQEEIAIGGSYQLSYSTCSYHVDYIEYHNGNYDNAELYSLRHNAEDIDATPAQVKKQLGEPLSEGTNELNDNWTLVYLADEYKVFISAEGPNSPIHDIHLKENKMTTLDLSAEHSSPEADLDQLKVQVRNPLDRAQVLEFTSGQEFDYKLIKDGKTIEVYSATRQFIQQMKSITLEADEVMTYTLTFEDLEPGEYVVEFWMTSSSHPNAQLTTSFESQ